VYRNSVHPLQAGSREVERRDDLQPRREPDRAIPYAGALPRPTRFDIHHPAARGHHLRDHGPCLRGPGPRGTAHPARHGDHHDAAPTAILQPVEVLTSATTVPAFVDPVLAALLIQLGTEFCAKPIREGGSPCATFLFGFGPALLIIVFYVWLYLRMRLGGGVG